MNKLNLQEMLLDQSQAAEPVTFKASFIQSTPEAVQFKVNGKRVWLPRSQIAAAYTNLSWNECDITMPHWLANNKDLLRPSPFRANPTTTVV